MTWSAVPVTSPAAPVTATVTAPRAPAASSPRLTFSDRLVWVAAPAVKQHQLISLLVPRPFARHGDYGVARTLNTPRRARDRDRHGAARARGIQPAPDVLRPPARRKAEGHVAGLG